MKKNIDYIIFILLLAFTTFEYFFRDNRLFFVLALISVVIAGWRGLFKKYNIIPSITFSVILMIWVFVQNAFIVGLPANLVISLFLTLAGTLSIALILKERFVAIFVTVIYYISIIAVTIYLLCISPSIKNFLLDVVCSNFTSMNVESAISDGGGKNFIIHNFASDRILDATGLMRNCGPFWEPGMFAVFLNVALFFNVIVEKQKVRFCNFILIIALITTFSTGGFLSALLILLSYLISNRNNIFILFFGMVGFVFISQYVMTLEYVGEKLVGQIENVDEGSDASRFNAFLTQIEMIKNSPILGGESMRDYLKGGNRTLASRTLLPFVQYGIPIGCYYVFTMLISLIRLVKSNGKDPLVGWLLFVSLLFLSFSQTILLSSWMMVFMFVGLNSSNNKYYGRQI